MWSQRAGTAALVATLAAAGCLERNAVPLVEVPPTSPSGEWLAVIISGDGGWASTDAKLADELLRHDIPTVGLNALRYFWFERTPKEASAVLRGILEEALPKWQRKGAIIIGFSRGANTAPFMVDFLPRDLKRRIGLVALLSPTVETNFVFRIRDWFSAKPHSDSIPVAPAVEKLAPIPTLCVYGRDDSDALCPHLPPGDTAVLRLPGGHHFGGATDRVVKRILETLDRTR